MAQAAFLFLASEVVADVLDTLRVTQRAAAQFMHVSPMALSNVIAGKTDFCLELRYSTASCSGTVPSSG